MKYLIGWEHIACEVNMMTAMSAVDIAFIMLSSKSAKFPSLSSVQCSQTFADSNRSVFFCNVFWKCMNKTITELVFTPHHALSNLVSDLSTSALGFSS